MLLIRDYSRDVLCALCHAKTLKPNLMRHIQRHHKELVSKKVQKMAVKLSHHFTEGGTKFVCTNENCLQVVSRKRRHNEHIDKLVKVKTRMDLPPSLRKLLYPVKEQQGEYSENN